jgi:hypothetical protein
MGRVVHFYYKILLFNDFSASFTPVIGKSEKFVRRKTEAKLDFLLPAGKHFVGFNDVRGFCRFHYEHPVGLQAFACLSAVKLPQI